MLENQDPETLAPAAFGRVRTSDIRKLSDFRSHATVHLDRLAETGAIEVLTVNGEAKGVVMSPKVFDDMADRLAAYERTESLRQGLADVKAGRVRPALQALDELAGRLGLDLASNPA